MRPLACLLLSAFICWGLASGVRMSSAIRGADPAGPGPNPLIDYDGFIRQAQRIHELRQQRRLTEKQFMEMSDDPNVIILDARSAEKFKQLHIRGARNLNFSDITEAELAKVIPDRQTTILIYCNNNFLYSAAFVTKRAVTSLNIHTWNTLFGYGYENVYELGPLLDVRETQLPLEGTDASQSRR